ncbi:uncharacterized protein LOC112467720 [Temnothorax curvispinosus]|uniref:Uncharacterized protein LOC112467720 n=1 Tax=Temnothorax curvispinosus TaxID=300111 RepID=A0A6J1RB26_9HYME|nr:uncharacterized protein LOC112467720 [Temnothorax curvispinosus]
MQEANHICKSWNTWVLKLDQMPIITVRRQMKIVFIRPRSKPRMQHGKGEFVVNNCEQLMLRTCLKLKDFYMVPESPTKDDVTTQNGEHRKKTGLTLTPINYIYC